MTAAPLTERWRAALMPTYAAPSMTLVRGEGARVWDEEGREYVDLVGGIAVSALGHAHPAVVEAVTRQVRTLAHASNLYASRPAVELAERLLSVLRREGRVFLCNSGAEANEAAFKLARRTGRPEVVAAHGAFHGRTMGALSLTGQPAKRAGFEPLVPGVVHVPYGDTDAMRAAVGAQTAAVILEPILGEAGVLPAPPGYLGAVREITAAAGALLILDEIQTGLGRTGAWFAHEHEGVEPDAVTIAKGLAGGLPIGALVAFDGAAELFAPGAHGTTFGGNPVACAAGLAVLDTIERDDLCG
ncbi:MAG: acetylornithine transaminase, partial [Actinomycetota bacterium]|nr:acetylornithine transaminase [Actinomycetota bacterium]